MRVLRAENRRPGGVCASTPAVFRTPALREALYFARASSLISTVYAGENFDVRADFFCISVRCGAAGAIIRCEAV